MKAFNIHIEIIIVACLVITSGRAFCQPPINYLGIEQGLSNNSVRSIYQDHKGFMWFGTMDGLNRYDGYEFKIFRNKFDDSTTLVSNIVLGITEDKNNNLWLSTRQGVSVYNPLNGLFTTLQWLPDKGGKPKKLNSVIKEVKIDPFNNILIAAELSGLLLCSNAELVAKPVPLLDKDNSLIYQYGVQVINVEDSKKVWVFVQGKGLFRMDYTDQVLKLVNNEIKAASCMTRDGDSIWIGTGEGVYSYNTRRNTIEKVLSTGPGALSSRLVTTIKLDRNKQLWIGTNGGGINIWNPAIDKMTYLDQGEEKESLNSRVVYSIFMDKELRTWMGTLRGGVNLIDPKKERFRKILHEPGFTSGLTGNYVSSFYEAGDSSLWVGMEGDGVNILEKDRSNALLYKKRNASLNDLNSESITCITGDSRNNTWISTFTEGIRRFDNATGHIRSYKTINEKTAIENNVVFFLYIDKNNTLWATTLRQGNFFGALYKFNYTSDKFELFDDRLSDLFVLKEDDSGNLWGGNLTQLVKIDRKNKQHSFYNIDQPVRTIAEDKAGNFWVGTEGGGLVLFDRKMNRIAARYTTSQGLCNNTILSVLEDKSGNLWMGTYYGLSKFNVTKRSFKNFYQSNGLQSNQFYYNCAIKLRSGAFAFGGIKGFSIFFPDNIGTDAMSSPPVITSLSIDGVSIDRDISLISKSEGNDIQELKIPYSKASLSVGFATMEYSSPDNISYAYYLEGWDKKWNYAGNVRTANYTHLPEGSYTMRVKSTNTEGVWNPKELTIRIIVLPPWYRAWWAWLFYIGVIAALVYYYILYKNQQAKLKYKVRLAQLQTEQEREINEKKLSFFTNISHEFRTPLTLIINPIKGLLQHKLLSKEAHELSTVYRNARRMLSLVDQLLLFRKAESGGDIMRVTKLNFHTLCQDVYLCFVHLASAKKIEYNFLGGNESLELYADREKMEIVLFNLISNALKYTGDEGKITFQIKEEDKWVEVSVEDNGAGISGEPGGDIFEKFYQSNTNSSRKNDGFGIGLYLVKHFTLAHKGTISYNSTPGIGTVFSLRLQKGKAHFQPEIIIENTIDAPALISESILADNQLEINGVSLEEGKQLGNMVSEKQTVLIVDDDQELRKYMVELFKEGFTVFDCSNGEKALKLAKEFQPDIIISDIKMEGLSGIDLCKTIKEDDSLKHIPVILLTGTSSEEIKLEGFKGGADDYITKPFEIELLMARVTNLLKSRSNLQQYFYNEITLNKHNVKISEQFKAFLEKCIVIVEENLDEDNFNINTLAAKMGTSRSVMFRKIKAISGQSPNSFIRFIRLRKAARLFIDTNNNVNEVATSVGIYDLKYFREHFNKLFGINPSDYIKKYRKPFAGKFNVNKEGIQQSDNEDES